MKKYFIAFVCSLVLLGSLPALAAGTWPQKNIQVVVPWNPGGGSDVSARIVMNKVAEILGQPVVITNIAGAGGLNGALRVFEAQPDGYTILWEHPANLGIAPAIGKAKFTWKSFAMACSAGTSDVAVIVKNSAKWNSMRELIDDIKAHPDTIRWNMGNYTASHFTYLALRESVGGLEAMHIPGSGDKNFIVNVISGVADVTTVAYAAAAPYVRSGDIKVLAMASPERSALAPEYPTLKEQGFDAESVFLYSVLFPKDTPQAIIDTFSAAVHEATKDPEVEALLRKQGIVAGYRDAAQTAAIWDKESTLYLHLAEKNKMLK